MKRIIMVLVIINLLIVFPLFSAEKGSAGILVYSFHNEYGLGANSHYSTILAEGLAGQLQASGHYRVEKNQSVKAAYRTNSPSRKVLERELRYTSEKQNYDVIISGSYRVNGNTITVLANVYMADADTIKVVVASGTSGVLFGSFINNLTEKILRIIRSSYSGTLSGPKILPEQRYFKHYSLISITSEPGAQLFYTLDGTTPKADTGIAYSEPFEIYESHSVSAVSYKNGSYSPVNRKQFTQMYRVSPFETKVLYGYAQFLSPSHMGDIGSSPVVSAMLCWEIATNDEVRKVPVLRDMGLMARGDFAGSNIEGPLYASLQNYSAGFFYRIRIGSRVMIDLPLNAGLNVCSHIDDGEEEFTSVFYKSGSAQDVSYQPVFSGALLFNWGFSHLGCTLGPSFSYIHNRDNAIMYIAWQGGLFVRI